MSVVFSRNGVIMPDLVRTKLANHLARLGRAADVHALALPKERVEGFVERVEAARALTPVNRPGFRRHLHASGLWHISRYTRLLDCRPQGRTITLPCQQLLFV